MDSSPPLPGVSVREKPRRFVPSFHWELIACGVEGHELVGMDVREIRPDDSLVVREYDGARWYRCLRCDSWLPLPPPENPARDHLPPIEEIELPLRGKPLRDKIVLRVIAVDRALHFVVLGLLAVAIFLFASHQQQLHARFYRVLADLQLAIGGGPVQQNGHGIIHSLDVLFTLSTSKLRLAGAAIGAYALLEGAEAVGLWFQKRWAEYLTFIATTALLPLEVYELTNSVSPFKVIALIVNIAIVIYLLLAKRLFGIRGGAAAEEALRERDVGLQALRRTTP
jgi:uncharacterized membrane protein (DUF2068 family)